MSPKKTKVSTLYTRVLFYWVLGFGVFTTLRLLLLFTYPEHFEKLNTLEILISFVTGFKFDLSILAWIYIIPMAMIFIPFPWRKNIFWQKIWGWYIFFGLAFSVFVSVGDLIYFGDVHRHIGSEISILSNDINSMIMLAVSSYSRHLLIFTIITALAAWGWRSIMAVPISAHPSKINLCVISFVFSFFLLISARGGLTGKPISVGDAFFSNSIEQGYLAMNGTFALSRGLMDKAIEPKIFYNQEQSDIHTVRLLKRNDLLKFNNVNYPLFQTNTTSSSNPKPNVVVIMLESWGAIHIDELRIKSGLQNLGVTPNFDAISKKGRLFTKFYANGQRSIEGASAILGSVATLPGMPFLGEGLEQNRLSFLGELAQNQGYETIFLQSSERYSLRFDSISKRAGFLTYLGAEDIPELHEYSKPLNNWGTWDHNTFQEANKRFSSAKAPFLGFIFTSTTHTPWLIPSDQWKKYPDGTNENKANNAIYYSDWALGEFFSSAKKSGYFDNTIFIITADHASEFTKDPSNVPNLFHIPLLILGPGVNPGVDSQISSQVDILPTIVKLAHWNTSFGSMGVSLVGSSNKSTSNYGALCVRGNMLNYINNGGWISHDLMKITSQSNSISLLNIKNIEKDLLSLYQTTVQVQLTNRILPP
jgi:phosphoglycerol transferase MdoB-like AlkP superfamily enzyme